MDYALSIDERRVISFVYDGLERVVQPATLGISTAGNLTLRACQIGGQSSRGVVPDWRLFTVAKITHPAIAGEAFTDFTMSGYTKGDSGFASIIAEH